MAIYHCAAQVISRSQGRSAVAAAAYRSGSNLYDERLGLQHRYDRKQGVTYSEIMAPPGVPAWVFERQQLWNAVEAAEKQQNSQLAREFDLALPVELTPAARRVLVRGFVQEQFVARGMIADLSIHEDNPANPHVHLMLTMRTVDAHGFGLKAREWNHKDLLQAQRAAWSDHVNRALEQAGHDARVDHRSFKDQGLDDRLPQIHLGVAAAGMIARAASNETILEHPRVDRFQEIQQFNERVVDLDREIAQERARLAAEAEAERRLVAARQRLAAEAAAERQRLEAEAAAEEARLAAEVAAAAERQRLEAAEAEKVRLAVEAERVRLEAEAAAERARLEVEVERQRLAAEAEAERQRMEAAEAEKARLAAEAERQRMEAEAAAEKARLAVEAERVRLAAEAEVERQRMEAEAAVVAEEARLAAEAEAERQRIEAEAAVVAEKARLAAEAERVRLAVEAAHQRLAAAAAAEKARLAAERQQQTAQREEWGWEITVVAASLLRAVNQAAYEGNLYRFVWDGETLTVEAKDGRGMLVKRQGDQLLFVSDQITKEDRDYFQTQDQAAKQRLLQPQLPQAAPGKSQPQPKVTRDGGEGR